MAPVVTRAAVLALLLLAAVPALADDGMTVVRAIDGDSLVVAWGPLQVEVRVENIDAPEWNAPGGPEASAAARRIAEGRACRLIYKERGRIHDRYGRTLARVEVRGDDGMWADFGETMIAGGFARPWIEQKPPATPPPTPPGAPEPFAP
jgi:micrococcal nuclease